MILDFLPSPLKEALKNINLNFLYEIRIRRGQPVILGYNGEYKYIDTFGLSQTPDRAIVIDDVEVILSHITQKSVYAYSEQLKQGFITIDGGVRVGICGEYVMQSGNIISVKNVTSINVRLPHRIIGCADNLYKTISKTGINNTLIFSPPGFGKTTLLRELTCLISENHLLNMLVCDERCEISAASGANFYFNLGKNCDIVRGADKLTAFANCVRSMNPQLIVCDELYGERDFSAAKFTIECGCKLISTTHLCDIKALSKFPFEYYVELSGIGKVAKVYDKNFNFISNCTTVGRPWNGVI